MRLRFKISILLFVFLFQFGFSQNQDDRLSDLKNKLEIAAALSPGLNEKLNTDIALNNISLSNFLLAVSNVHKVNMNIAPDIEQTVVTNNFSNVNVSTALLFICKEYNLTIDFTENILSIKPYDIGEVLPEQYPFIVEYEPQYNEIDMDVKNNDLYDVFKAIMDATGKNLVFAPGMENVKLNAYMKAVRFDIAMDKLALTNNLSFNKTDDNFYVFDKIINQPTENRNNFSSRINPNLSFEIIDKITQQLNVNFQSTPIEDIVNQIGDSLDINKFTATPLNEAGNVTFRATNITFDELLTKIFEQQGEVVKTSKLNTTTSSNRVNSSDNNKGSKRKKFTFKKENDIYYFGTEHQLSVRNVEIIRLRHRSVNLMPDTQSDINNSVVEGNFNRSNRNVRLNTQGGNFNTNIRPQDRNYQNNNTLEIEGEEQDILSLIPEEVKEGLDFKVDIELNSLYVTGTGTKIEFFKNFIETIDRPIPVIIIEVMIVEAQVTNTIEAGVEWGIGNEPTTTQGGLFPTTDITLGAKTVNRIISGFSSTSAFNFGRVVPNFFATIKAMEANGDLKIKSTPKLATLNGHRASFSNGQTSYYAVTDRNTFGTDNPVTSEIRNFFPIDAKLGLDIKPYVTGDGQVLLNIKVVQSSFGNRISEDAPPDINSRNFSSTVRMKDQDIAVLGGLEENFKNNSGSGVPFLARVPVLKWLFSKRTREARKSKLTVFIKPTVIN